MKRLLATVCAAAATTTLAGPPYVTDDPEPTALGHYEIYGFTDGSSARDAWDGSAGIDFNYGAAPDLQLTAVLPVAWNSPDDGPTRSDFGNIELAAKRRFLHQADVGVDVAFFPRVFLPAGSAAVGERHTSLLLPIWIGNTGEKWSTFGGGGCVIDRGGDSRDFFLVGWAVTYQASANLQIGGEIFHQSADQKGGHASTGVGLGATFDVSDHLHLMASAGPGIQNAAATSEAAWYASLLVSF